MPSPLGQSSCLLLRPFWSQSSMLFNSQFHWPTSQAIYHFLCHSTWLLFFSYQVVSRYLLWKRLLITQWWVLEGGEWYAPHQGTHVQVLWPWEVQQAIPLGSLCFLHLAWWACSQVKGPIQTSQLSTINKSRRYMCSFVSQGRGCIPKSCFKGETGETYIFWTFWWTGDMILTIPDTRMKGKQVMSSSVGSEATTIKMSTQVWLYG